jgi:hypothetical protein
VFTVAAQVRGGGGSSAWTQEGEARDGGIMAREGMKGDSNNIVH